MNIKNQVKKMDEMVSQGDIVNAVKVFFSNEASTSDYGNVRTDGKQQMIEKMEGFVSAIDKVKGIAHHFSIVEGNISASEFTFQFEMKDGSEIFWHEIIRRIWNEKGLVISEEYFNAKTS